MSPLWVFCVLFTFSSGDKLWAFLVKLWASRCPSISPYLSFFVTLLSSFLPPQSTQVLHFLKTIWLDISPDSNFLNNAEYHPVVSTRGRKSVRHELQNISYVREQYHFYSASKRTVIIGKWQHHCNFVESSTVYVKLHFKGTPICKSQLTQPGFQTQSLQIFSFNCCSCYKFYWS